MKVRFYLVKKESEEVKEAKKAHKALQQELDLVQEKIKELGYDSETVSEVYRILNRPYGHPVFLHKTEQTEREVIGEIIGEWKPVYQESFDYTDLPSMKHFVERQTDKEIIRVEGRSQQTLSFDEFVNEMQNHSWTKFGMPSKYNRAEETIWDRIR